ncbi:MAG: von Willebrand factor type A domain-containing protein [Lachnospiraceae bacterium]|nr:von Willebrand factor type A domain-containing protein [Lachnospiraceae bacterium]
MKRNLIAAILIGSIVMTSLSGCGSDHEAATTDTSPAYIEAEYPEGSPAAETRDESAASDQSAGSEGVVYTTEESPAAECKEAGAATEYAADSCAAGSTTDSYAAKYAAESCAAEVEEYWPGCDLPEPVYNSGENYKSVNENSFTDVTSSPLSTFGADIDTASYSNLRRMINDGYSLSDIPGGSIRTEELVNYFDYDYKKPGRNDTFAVNASIIDCPWNRETKLVNLGIKAKELNTIEDTPSNIVFLIDVSGSMESYDKLPLLQMGFDMLVDSLDENDRVSIVTYASSSDIVLSGVPGNKRSEIKRAINDLSASGSTNGGDGIRSAYKLAEKYFIKGGNNRVIMATDGDLNVGVTSESELEELISEKKEGGVFLSVLGFGTGNYNEATLETLADKGNGNYSYIDCLSEAKKTLIDEFNSTLFTVAKDVKFQTEFNPKYVSEYRLIGYENRQMAAKDFSDDTKDGGEIGSGHAMTVMYEIKMKEDVRDDNTSLRYQNTDLSEIGEASNEWMTVSVRYKEPEEDESKLIYFPVGSECYTAKPNCDTLFAAYVAECGMVINESEYIGNLSMQEVSDQVAKLELDDEYKEEFLDLIRQI